MRKYIALTEGLTFQRHPTGATLFKVVKGSEGRTNKFRKTVNMDAARILELCDGIALNDLLEKHNRSYPASQLTEEVANAFFAAAEKEEMIFVSSEKTACAVRFAGSYDHYFPQHSSIELTDQCNYRCKHCYRESSPERNNRLDFGKVKEYIEALWANGGSVLELTGGEPLLYEHFFEVVDFAYPKMGMVCILTNGYYLQEDAVKRLLKYKDKLVFNISLDSHKPEFHNAFRGKSDAYEKTLNAMRLLGENGFVYRVAMSVSSENNYDIAETIQLARKCGAKLFAYTHVTNVGRGGDVLAAGRQMTEADVRKMVDYELRVREENKDIMHFLTVTQVNELKATNCGIIHRSVTLGPDGVIRPCIMFGGDVIEIGNINRQSYREIFEGGIGKAFAHMSGPKAEVCGDCKHLFYCGNCILRGIQKGMELNGCKWLEKTGVLKYIKGAPQRRVCGNAQEPCNG
ncbi:MAG: hypothetical protein A2081_02780 [Elusimicrobia bacterium GWC2_61_19]|nr:MAG: hypothetical protein A2081_02780 [Elusimicrobia bacterium GWC2_61_19]